MVWFDIIKMVEHFPLVTGTIFICIPRLYPSPTSTRHLHPSPISLPHFYPSPISILHLIPHLHPSPHIDHSPIRQPISSNRLLHHLHPSPSHSYIAIPHLHPPDPYASTILQARKTFGYTVPELIAMKSKDREQVFDHTLSIPYFYSIPLLSLLN